MQTQLSDKLENLERHLRGFDSILVAYSGGVDSSLLLKVAVSVLGDRALAVIANSPTYPPSEFREALDLARKIGTEPIVVETKELSDSRFSTNPPERCYYCKLELFQNLRKIAISRDIRRIADGSNCDDLLDYRPGARAAEEMGVVSPLREVGLTKRDVREIARELGLPNWSKSAQACLASRVPYGTTITRAMLERISRAEECLTKRGFTQVRLRAHGDIARIEVLREELDKLLLPEVRESVVVDLKRLGFTFISVDLEGYRTGSMNELISRRSARVQTDGAVQASGGDT